MKKLIRLNAIQILEENAKAAEMDLHTYYKENTKQDPRFFKWLFTDSENIGDFGIGMTAEQFAALEEFEESLLTLCEIRREFEL